jgi:hypothetical protein
MAATTASCPEVTLTGKALITLPVPYFCQRDSATWQGHRMCYSSTCTMAAAFLKPGCMAGAGQPDDRYLAQVERFGDTTSSQAQIAALQRLGIQATFRTDGRIEQLIAQLRLGFPIPVGWLHHGPAAAPRGGGTGAWWWAGIQPPARCSCTIRHWLSHVIGRAYREGDLLAFWPFQQTRTTPSKPARIWSRPNAAWRRWPIAAGEEVPFHRGQAIIGVRIPTCLIALTLFCKKSCNFKSKLAKFVIRWLVPSPCNIPLCHLIGHPLLNSPLRVLPGADE